MQTAGDAKSVIDLINSTELTPTFKNPASKFVVITYWWGKENINRNLQRPCPEDITEPIKWDIEETLAQEDRDSGGKNGLGKIYDKIAELKKKRDDDGLTDEEVSEIRSLFGRATEIMRPMFAEQRIKDMLNKAYAAAVATLKSEGKFTEAGTFSDMIKHWEKTMDAANCNYMATNIEFSRMDYQNAINGKPLFIRRALDKLQEVGKGDMGVLYIDGDMDIHTYPGVFDIPNVDFMARGWNVDPRDNHKYLEDLCFDPYVFETSGGTMYFGNTQTSRLLLDAWAAASADPKQAGKADDRILSMVFTQKKFALEGSVIQLPIEYLWLTDKYAGRFEPPAPQDADHKSAIIEHPACLTGEERAADQGAAQNRYPIGYAEIEESQRCATRGGVFYEYIAFPSVETMAGFRKYLDYMKKAVQPETGEALFEIVPHAQMYGRYKTLAEKNEAAAKVISSAPGFPSEMEVKLPQTAPIPEILAHLMKGHSVFIGGVPRKMPLLDDTEFVGRNMGEEEDPFHIQLKLDSNAPMYIKPTNPIVIHLLKMCTTLEDINTHLMESYMFLSRIRWLLASDTEEAAAKKEMIKTSRKSPFGEELPKMVTPESRGRKRTGGRRKPTKKSTLRQKRI
jgi:hypothetical protein